MTSEQKTILGKLYFEIGELHGRTISKDTLITMVNSFNDLNFGQVHSVMQGWLMNGTHFPLPAHIRQKVVPQMDDKDNAIDAVNRIIAAVSRFGWTNSQSAKEFMGELAWETCTRFGGWKSLCETLCGENEGILRAQLRELAGVVAKKSMRGELNLVPSLPTPETNHVKNLINTTIKSLT
jgi:hypothetical protein